MCSKSPKLLQTGCRRGASLVEILVCLGILSVLLGLILSAVVTVRQSAALVQCKNRQRQLAIALQGYLGDHQGRMPSCDGDILMLDGFVNMGRQGHFTTLYPYFDPGTASQWLTTKGWMTPFVSWSLLCPSDPSLSYVDPLERIDLSDKSTYVANWQVFGDNEGRSITTVTDGLSNTIGYSERYAKKCGDLLNQFCIPGSGLNPYRPVFADGGTGSRNRFLGLDAYHDYPVPHPSGQSHGSRNRIFQTLPSLDDCDARLPVGCHANGLVVTMLDGSCRLLNKSIEQPLFWSLVSAKGGETVMVD
jgi:type II secretory pathway pseudopilin PulG